VAGFTGAWNPWLDLRDRTPSGALYQFTLAGQVVAANGAAVTGATVWLFDGMTNLPIATTTTDSFGMFQFQPPTNGPYWCRFFKAGAPNFFGTTDILVPS